jgi:hypothetical protein
MLEILCSDLAPKHTVTYHILRHDSQLHVTYQMTDTWRFFPLKTRSNWSNFAGVEHDASKVRFQRYGPITVDDTGDRLDISDDRNSKAQLSNGQMPAHALLSGSGMAMGWMARPVQCSHAVNSVASRSMSVDAEEINENAAANNGMMPRV